MATVREGNRGVLLVVDVQVAVVESIWEGARVVKNVARVVERARAAGVAVLWVQQSDEDLPQGSPQWEWAPELVPAPTEARIHKHYNSAFEQTNLEQQLAALAATHITLAGAASNWCLRSTAYAALERGYDLTLVSDAHSTESMELDDGSCVRRGASSKTSILRWRGSAIRIERTASPPRRRRVSPLNVCRR